MDDTSSRQHAGNAFPTARVESAPSAGRLAGKMVSRLWIVTGLCLLAALGLVLAELGPGSHQIEIIFSEGHGLEPGDPVRYRGIDVGEVKSVALDDSQNHVRVTVVLRPEASGMAREGTHFWVERPNIRLGQVRGLETLVGGRFVGVMPGPSSAAKTSVFEGLPDAPATVESVFEGLEVVLEGTHRFGLERGSPVSYRGVEVGRVISVGLTNDSASVVARTFIRPQYRTLIRENTRFWSNSGIGFQLGFGGLELDAETLATIAAGGVSLATPNVPGEQATTGHRFELFEAPRDEWLQWQPRIAIGTASLPENVATPRPVLGVCRSQSGLSMFGRSRRRGWILPLSSGRMLGPSNLLSHPEQGSFVLEVWGEQLPLDAESVLTVGELSARVIPESMRGQIEAWPAERIRSVDEPVEVVITCGSDDMTMPLVPARMTVSEHDWAIDSSVPLDESWHGASVVAARDGFLIGLLIHTEEGMLIVPITSKLLNTESRASKGET